MSTTPTIAHPLQTYATEPQVHRHVGDCPDLLSETYAVACKLPAVVALWTCWIQLHRGRAVDLASMGQMSFTFEYLLIAIAVYACWNLCVPVMSAGARVLPRLKFVLSQGSFVLLGTACCSVLLLVAKLLRLQAMSGISVSGFALRSVVYGTLCVLAAASMYEAAYQLSTPHMCVIVGTRQRALQGFRRLSSHAERKGVVLGFVDRDPSHADQLPRDYLGSIKDLEFFLATHHVDLVYLALPLRSMYSDVHEAIQICERVGVRYVCAPDLFETVVKQSRGTPVHNLESTLRIFSDYRLLIKRGMDLVLGLLLVLAFFPLGLLIALLVKLSSPGPVFFVQQRYGKNRKLFPMYKFRSMVVDAEQLQDGLEHANEAGGPIFKIKRDTRVTSVGRILRMLSLDELPQLINVLKGEMSLVGPRPMSTRDVHRFSETRLLQRFSVTPGLTGLWQVSGRSNLSFEAWTQLDMDYINRWSLMLDMQILLRTIPAVLASEGAV